MSRAISLLNNDIYKADRSLDSATFLGTKTVNHLGVRQDSAGV